jgi:hypothetical protein
MKPTHQERLFDTDGASGFLNCTSSALVKFRSERRGPPYVKVGRLIRYRHRDLVRWLRSQRVMPETGPRKEADKI